MSRWDYDTVFYRVFCITLLSVAFTFTLILTNVFVDIDGLLSKKKDDPSTEVPATLSPVFDQYNPPMEDSEDFYDEKDYQDSNDLYRSKRSLESQDILLQIKDPTVKKILTNRLSTLLDELDDEEVTNNKNFKTTSNEAKEDTEKNVNLNRKTTKDDSNEFLKLHQILAGDNELANTKKHFKNDNILKHEEKVKTDKTQKDLNIFSNKDINKEELLHLAMHNIILQGIIGNMKMENVYKKVHDLVKNFDSHKDTRVIKVEHSGKTHNSEELKFLDEISNCKDLQIQIATEYDKKSNSENLLRRINGIAGNNGKRKDPSVLIKTIIDITGPPNEKVDSDSFINPKANLDGVVKLVYNGKAIRFKRIDDPTSNAPAISEISYQTEAPERKNVEIISKDVHDTKTPSESSYKNIIQNYLKRLSKDETSEHNKLYSRKRLKRHIKIRYDSVTTEKPKHKKHDDELFVEIETHFDSHGTKGQKKKKLIRDLIEKIKKAIHSDSEVKPKKHKHLHVKKRMQNRLDNVSPPFVSNVLIPVQNVNHRNIDPISKSVPMHEKMPLLNDERGDNHWKQNYNGPGFLVKTINSAEMSSVDTEYDKVINFNGIPQRMQIPLNTDISEEVLNTGTSTFDLGNIKFLVKDIEGSGFSIGFNQFQGESPDPETIKLFTGLENVIQTYHQKYDQEVTESTKPIDDFMNLDENDYMNEHVTQDNAKEHSISRRSIAKDNGTHKHYNEYKNFVSSNYLPFDSYQAIYNKGDESYKKRLDQIIKLKSLSDSVLAIDDNIFEKELKPAEIFSIAELIDRKKRSLKVRQISNIKSKKKMNRYLNTKAMASKSIFHRDHSKGRFKRQINKIRIVARDSVGPQIPRTSEEDIFVVSDEKVYADRAVFSDRAVLREMGMPDTEQNIKLPLIEHYDKHYDVYAPEAHYDIVSQPGKELDGHNDSPFILEGPSFDDPMNAYSRSKSRLGSLMAKYPHIIMEENESKEEDSMPLRRNMDSTTFEPVTNLSIPINPTEIDMSSNLPDIADLLMPQDKSNYKVTVKIRPKNSTMNNGFKEVHTSINKSFNKNGLIFTSLVNVSEISKVEKMTKNFTASRRGYDLKKQQDYLKSLIRRHKSRIEQQLNILKSEKQKLEMLNEENRDSEYSDNFEFATETNNKIKAEESTTETAKNTTEGVTPTSTLTTTAGTTTKTSATITTTTTTNPTTTKPTTTFTTPDPDKIKIITTIERNENLTTEILKRIEKNTGILETFLDKLFNTMYLRTEARTTVANTDTTTVTETPHFNHNVPNSIIKAMNRDITKNQSFGIPFVYAYQQRLSPDTNVPTTNIIYQGRIHSNDIFNEHTTKKYYDADKVKINKVVESIEKIDKTAFFKAKPGEKVLNNYILKNNTRFYLDELGEDYRKNMVPLANARNVFATFSAPVNSTHINI